MRDLIKTLKLMAKKPINVSFSMAFCFSVNSSCMCLCVSLACLHECLRTCTVQRSRCHNLLKVFRMRLRKQYKHFVCSVFLFCFFAISVQTSPLCIHCLTTLYRDAQRSPYSLNAGSCSSSNVNVEKMDEKRILN